MKSILALIAIGFFVSGCQSSSGVVSVGPNQYLISRTEKGTRGSGSLVKAAAIREANEFAAARGKVAKILSETQQDMKPFRSDASAEIRFELVEPTASPAPSNP